MSEATQDPTDYSHDHYCSGNHVPDGTPCPGNPRDSDHGDRGGWTKVIEDAAKELRNNGDRWENSARKSWRREDVANNRWITVTRDLGTVTAKLTAAEERLARVAGVIAEHEDCGDGCIASLLFGELKDAMES